MGLNLRLYHETQLFSPVTYTADVTNLGPPAAFNAILSDTLSGTGKFLLRNRDDWKLHGRVHRRLQPLVTPAPHAPSHCPSHLNASSCISRLNWCGASYNRQC